MSQARHARVKELFLAACDLDSAGQRALLERECGADADLRGEVEQMLGFDTAGVPALEKPAAPTGRASASEPARIPVEEVERLAARASTRCYQLEEELGRGGMGRILRARDVDLRRDLAMKISLGWLRSQGSRAGEAGATLESARFLEEARITARLDHPGIVPVHDLGVDGEGRLFFTMKLVQGRDLGEILRLARAKQEGWTTTRVAGVLQKVCEAVAFAHTKGVVHRDLKPANVMVGEFGEVYVMDWGISRVLGDRDGDMVEQDGGTPREPGAAASESPALTRAGSILGTPYGMPPEQARGEPVGPPADVYAVGAMLYQALAGRRPYEREGGRDSAAAVLVAIQRGPPTPLRELAPKASPELVAIAERAMAPQPQDRYGDMRALADDLRAYLEGRVVRAHRTGALAELRKWIARNRLAASGVSVALLAVIGGLAWSRQAEIESKREIDLASDYFRARVVRDSAGELWPATPATIPLLEDWTARAEALLARRELHVARSKELESTTPADPTELGRQRALVQYLDELDGRERDGHGLLRAVNARLEFARTIEARSITAPEVAERWRTARAAILAGTTHAAYAGLDLAPQLGLLPLGPDPVSGLYEFAHLETGAPPERGPDGRLVLGPETGLVLVLLPGGSFFMGGGEREGEPNFDRAAARSERPVLEVTLEPFFIAKHELTQTQWGKIAGYNPSRWPPGHHATVTATNPVEQVSWHEAKTMLARMGLVLPTEARWEYACRAGSDTPYTCDASELVRFANLSDKSHGAVFNQAMALEAFDDGFPYHAPVGSFAPNAFGLHDVHGNVFEWVLDPYGSYAYPRDPRDGSTLGPDPSREKHWFSSDYRVARGGNYEVPVGFARSSHRVAMHPSFINHALGVRPAREIEPIDRR